MCYGGAIFVMGGVLCVMMVYGVLWRCTVCYGSVLCVMAVYSMLWRCTVW